MASSSGPTYEMIKDLLGGHEVKLFPIDDTFELDFKLAVGNGNLGRFKKLAAKLDDGKGIQKTVAGMRDNLGLTPLHIACIAGRMNMVQFLIRDMKVDIDEKEVQGARTALHLAFEKGRSEIAKFLLEKGANPHFAWPNEKGFAPLHYAAQTGDKGLVTMLLAKGVNVNALSTDGTPLQWAACKGKHEVVQILLNHNAKPNLNYRNVCTPLLASISANSLSCVQHLLEAGADPDGGGLGMTPLELAATDGQTSMIQSLLKAGANPNLTTQEGLKPIEIVAVKGNREAVEILFPATSQISTYPEWSVSGIMRHASQQGKLVKKAKFEDAKLKGDEAFSKKNYMTASLWYTKAIMKDPSNAILFSNRSYCWLLLNDGNAALNDALYCVLLKSNWPKAYYRLGSAWKMLKRFNLAADAFKDGLRNDPENKEIEKEYQEAVVDYVTCTMAEMTLQRFMDPSTAQHPTRGSLFESTFRGGW